MDQIRALLKQIRPEGRHAIRFWLSEGFAFGEEHSREVRKGISEHSHEAARMSELLEPLLWNFKDLDPCASCSMGWTWSLRGSQKLSERR